MKRIIELLALTILILLTLSYTVFADGKQSIQLEKMDSSAFEGRTELKIRPNAPGNLPCYVGPADDLIWRVNGWITGNELYKNYLDPSEACENPYPYTITEINMPMYFGKAATIFVSVDIEDVYYSTPECPWPDSVLAISSDYQINIPKAGLYDIWVPLDVPIVVNRPFFAGFFVGSSVDSSAQVALLTNSNASSVCRSYNIWAEEIGFVDLLNNGLWEFPGQLILYASGYPGGREKRVEPEPEMSILSPQNKQQLLGQAEIWAHESSGSGIIDHVTFEYSAGNELVEIGRDYEGDRPLRDGLNYAGSGDGYRQTWDFASLAEGDYTLRVTAYDTLGRRSSDEITVYLEPTPPTPKIIAPIEGSDFCSDVTVLMSCPDENIKDIKLYRKDIDDEYSAGIKPLSQFAYGDGNGNRNDGNYAANDEYADYYSGPVAAAAAINLWAERGYKSLISGKTSGDLVEHLASTFRTRQNLGTFDEDLYRGLLEYGSEHGDIIKVENFRRPDYFTLRRLVEDEQQAVLLALGGKPGIWLIVDGFSEWKQTDNTYLLALGDPFTGVTEFFDLRQTSRGSKLNYAGLWQPIDLAIAVGVRDWEIDREFIGKDTEEFDGWSVNWAPEDPPANGRYFIRAEGLDSDGTESDHAIVINHNCEQFFVVGDYDGDGAADIVDLAYLAEFVTNEGPQPVGGASRADANGDTHLNITDLVYYINYLYGMADPPSR